MSHISTVKNQPVLKPLKPSQSQRALLGKVERRILNNQLKLRSTREQLRNEESLKNISSTNEKKLLEIIESSEKTENKNQAIIFKIPNNKRLLENLQNKKILNDKNLINDQKKMNSLDAEDKKN